MVCLGAETHVDGVGEFALRGKPVVADVHRGYVVVLCAKAQAGYHAAIGHIVSNLGFLLRIDAVVKKHDIAVQSPAAKSNNN